MKIAVIGSGISGLLAANLLAGEHEVRLLEANDYLGGHTNTIEVELGDAPDGSMETSVNPRKYLVDTGFMVFNQRTYPNFCRLLEILGVESQESDMSFSVSCRRTGLEYQGSSLNGLFAQRRNLFSPRFYRLLLDILRFNRDALSLLDHQTNEADSTLGEYVRQQRYSEQFINQYLVPMGAAIWSARPQDLLEFPSRFIIRFFQNHGLLQIRNRPIWRTIPGGARRYVERLASPLGPNARLRSPVDRVQRHEDHVLVTLRNGESEIFSHVVFATHADQTLRMLTDASPAEREILASFPYQRNLAVIHTDTSLLPSSLRAWASWNYLVPPNVKGDALPAVAVTYDLSRLQKVLSPRPILATLNHVKSINPEQILRKIEYHHPVFGTAAIAAQRRHGEISGQQRTHFCGAYWGNGFHEDGVNSALAVAKYFGKTLNSCTVASTKAEYSIAVSVP